jgi:hypothetical protein
VAYTVNAVVTYQFSFEDFTFTYYLDGAMTAADVGKAMTLDFTGTNKMKLAEAGDPIHGRLETFEDRTQEGVKTGAVSRHFRSKLPTTGAVALGDNLIGSATAGIAATGAVPAGEGRNYVVEVGNGFAIVEKFS